MARVAGTGGVLMSRPVTIMYLHLHVDVKQFLSKNFIIGLPSPAFGTALRYPYAVFSVGFGASYRYRGKQHYEKQV